MARFHRRNSKGRFVGFGRKHHKRSYKGLARHHRARRHYKGLGRHHRRFRGLADMPKLDTLKQSVNGHDALMGAGIGILGIIVTNYLINSQKSGSLQQKISQTPWMGGAAALIGAAAAGVAGYALLHKGEGGGKAAGYLVGAVGAGIAVAGARVVDAGYLAGNNATGAGAKTAYLNPPAPVIVAATPVATATSGYGLVRKDRPYGMLRNDRAPGALAALSMALDDGDDIEAVLNM